MKKFVFTLQPLFKVKTAQEKQKKIDYKKALDVLALLNAEKDDAEKKLAENNEKYRYIQREGCGAAELITYANYIDYQNKNIAAICEKIAKADEIRRAILDELVTLMKEIKALNKLRDKQYAAYVEESLKEEEKELNDIVSFKSITSEDDAPAQNAHGGQ